jgi:DNA-binding HxlR family transcriptional regulator
MMFAGKRHFREMLQSDEQISTNILADRLKILVEQGLITKAPDPTHQQKGIYSLTEKGIALLPILVQIGMWGRRFLPASDKADPQLKAFNRKLERGGPALWKELMAALRETLLGGKRSRGSGATGV